ncbi:MAG: cell division protein FtsA [Chloroflexota bacterium]
MGKRSIITAIDVGTTKVCTIIAEAKDDGGLRVVGVGTVPSSGMHKGMVTDISNVRETIRASVRKAERACNYKVESAYVGVTGRHITSTNSRGQVSITRNDRLVRIDDLRRVLTSAQSVKIPSDRKLLHVIPRTYAIDGQEGVQNPVGMHGFRLDVETHIITAAITSVQNLMKCVRNLGIDIDDLVLEPIASAEAVLTEDEKQKGVVLAEIGGGTSEIAVFKDGSIFHAAALPVAGYQITRDIAIGLGLTFDVAEQMKKTYGSLKPVYDASMQMPKAMSSDGHGESYQDLCEIIRARVDEILRLMLLEMPAEYQSIVPAGLVLTGGGSNLAGLDSLARDIWRLPARIGTPLALDGVTEGLKDPTYATAVGLILWANKNRTRHWRSNRLFGWGLWRFVSQIVAMFRRNLV